MKYNQDEQKYDMHYNFNCWNQYESYEAYLSATSPLSAAARLHYERVYTLRDRSASEIYW